jgi:hypothetical protein
LLIFQDSSSSSENDFDETYDPIIDSSHTPRKKRRTTCKKTITPEESSLPKKTLRSEGTKTLELLPPIKTIRDTETKTPKEPKRTLRSGKNTSRGEKTRKVKFLLL